MLDRWYSANTDPVIKEVCLAFLSVMSVAWMYWFLFIILTFPFHISDSYMWLFTLLSGLAFGPALLAGALAGYKAPRQLRLHNDQEFYVL